MNGKVIMPKQGLMSKAINKTIYLTPEMGDSIVLIMYAENLGSIPPNTGLLVVHDGNDIYEIRFSGDLQKNSAIILRRKRKIKLVKKRLSMPVISQDVNKEASIKLTQYSHGAGCGCKISPLILDKILSGNLAVPDNKKLIVGNHTKDDAAVYDLGQWNCIDFYYRFFYANS